jgi:hypothetical protein
MFYGFQETSSYIAFNAMYIKFYTIPSKYRTQHREHYMPGVLVEAHVFYVRTATQHREPYMPGVLVEAHVFM